MKKGFKWGVINHTQGPLGYSTTSSVEVPGGWLVKEVEYREGESPDNPPSVAVSICFVPKQKVQV